MLVSLLDISLLPYFQMFILDNSVGTFTFPRPSMGVCLDVYTYNLCQQICFHSSLCGLMRGQLLYLQFLLTNLFSFVLMWTYAWIAFILAILVSKFAFLRPYMDGDNFHSFRNVIVFYCGGQCASFQEYYRPYVGKDDLHPLGYIIASCGRGQCAFLWEYYRL